MRDQWVRLEGWLKATVGQAARSWIRRVGGALQQGARHAGTGMRDRTARVGAGLRQTTKRAYKHGARPVAVVVDGVVQVDPAEAARWHAAWLAYLDAQRCAVAARQAARQRAHEEDL
jgi:hypothetical protein